MLEIKKSHQDQTLATDKMVQNLVSYGEVVIVLFSLISIFIAGQGNQIISSSDELNI